MKRAVRVGLVILEAAIAVYGAASLTGGWLGTPPWADRVHTTHSLEVQFVRTIPSRVWAPLEVQPHRHRTAEESD